MANTLSVIGSSRAAWSLSGDPAIGSTSDSAAVASTWTAANGTGAGQANAAWRNRVTIANGQTYSLELRNLGANAFGFAGKVTVDTLKEIIVVVNTTTAGRYVLVGCIGPSDTTAYSARLNGGGVYHVADYAVGWPVTENVNDVVYIANPSGGSVEIDIGVVGVGTFADT